VLSRGLDSSLRCADIVFYMARFLRVVQM
jgi:hypothetical protein